MATIVQAVHGFLREMEWHWEQLDEHRLRVLVSGDACQWTWLAIWDEDDTSFLSYAICPFQIPKSRRLADELIEALYTGETSRPTGCSPPVELTHVTSFTPSLAL
jgi:hypothetical protein